MVSKTDVTYTLELNEHEAYTLQLLLGFVAGDSEVYSMTTKLEALTGDEMGCEDFDRVKFTVENDSWGTTIPVDGENHVVVRIK